MSIIPITKYGNELADLDFELAHRRGDELLHRAALPFARDRQRRQKRADHRHHQGDHAGHDVRHAFQVLVEPRPRLEGDGGRTRGEARARCCQSICTSRGIALHDGLRVAHADAGGSCCRWRRAAPARSRGRWSAASSENCGGTTTATRAHAMIDVPDDVRIAVGDANDVEIVGRLKVLEQVLAGLRPVPVVDAERHVLDVEIYGVAVNEQLDQRHGENDQQASRIAPI